MRSHDKPGASKRETLPIELVWQDDGHVSEIGLGALADGQPGALPTSAVDHVDGCAACTARLGEAALLSVRVGEALRSRAASRGAAAVVPIRTRLDVPVSSRRRPIPVFAVAAALFIAAIAASPSVLAASHDVPGAIASIGKPLSFTAHLLVLLVRGGWEPSRAVLVAQGLVAALLVAAGLAVAARVTRRRSIEGDA